VLAAGRAGGVCFGPKLCRVGGIFLLTSVWD
jgi:hypothetical protein